jgi:hypothetical protein
VQRWLEKQSNLNCQEYITGEKMKNYNNRLYKSIGILGIACGSLLIALPAVAIAPVGGKPGLAHLSKNINQKATYNSRNFAQGSQATPTPVQSPLPEQQQPPSTPTPIQPPLPEQQQPPSTTVVLNQGKVSIKLVNRTGAKITYQAIGNTAPRSLPGKSNITLKDLAAPITVTFKRDDGGLLNATGRSLTPGVLELTLDATTDLGIDKQSMQIQPTGDVFLN